MAEWYDNQNMGSAFPLMDYGANRLANYVNQNLPNNQNNSGLQWWMNADRSRYPSPIMPKMLDQTGQMGASNYQDLGNATVVDENRIPGRIQEELPTNTGFSFDPRNWGVMGLMKKMIAPNTPEENFGRGYFNTDSGGRTYGNQAHDVFAGKNVASAFGKGMGAAAQKRIDTINATLAKWEADPSKYGKELDEEGNIIGTTLYDKRANFNKQLAHYRKNLQASTSGKDTTGGDVTTGGAVTTGNVITSQGDQVNTGGGQRDTSGWSSPGYSTRGGFTGTGGSPGTGQRGHHGNWAEGGRIGYRWGELVDENIEGPGFDENIEMASAVDPMDALNDMSMDIFNGRQLHELTPEEYQLLIDMANDQAMGEQDQGIASLV